jgi:uncharacterized membrane protein
MNRLLWLLLILRVLCVLAPFLAGLVITLLLFGHIHPTLPGGWTAFVFVFFVLFVAGSIKGAFPNTRDRSSSRRGRQNDQD